MATTKPVSTSAVTSNENSTTWRASEMKDVSDNRRAVTRWPSPVMDLTDPEVRGQVQTEVQADLDSGISHIAGYEAHVRKHGVPQHHHNYDHSL